MLIFGAFGGKINLRHNSIFKRRIVCVFIFHDKNACSIFAYYIAVSKNCVAAIGAMRFLCAASAAHFYFADKLNAREKNRFFLESKKQEVKFMDIKGEYHFLSEKIEDEENIEEEFEMNTVAKLKTLLITGATVIAVLILIILLIYFGGYKKAQKKYEEKIAQLEEELADRVLVYEEVSTEVDMSVIEEQIHNIGELATVEYLYTDAGRFSDTNQLFGMDIGITQKSFIAKWDGAIKAGIDIEKVEISYNQVAKTITVSLPKSEILSHEIDDETVETLDQKDGLFNPVKVEDVRVFDSESKIAMEERAIKNGLLEKADKNAKNIISNLLYGNPELKNYKIEFVVAE